MDYGITLINQAYRELHSRRSREHFTPLGAPQAVGLGWGITGTLQPVNNNRRRHLVDLLSSPHTNSQKAITHFSRSPDIFIFIPRNLSHPSPNTSQYAGSISDTTTGLPATGIATFSRCSVAACIAVTLPRGTIRHRALHIHRHDSFTVRERKTIPENISLPRQANNDQLECPHGLVRPIDHYLRVVNLYHAL